jgi:DNA-binding transcriptional ArsR family regulator
MAAPRLQRSRSSFFSLHAGAGAQARFSVDILTSVRGNLPLVDAYLQAGLDALGDATRMAIFQKLAGGPTAVNELARALPVSRPAVSQHLRVLKDAGLVTDSKAGTRRLYQLNPEGVARLRAHFDQMWTKAMTAFQAAAEKEPLGEKHGKHPRKQSAKQGRRTRRT